VASPLLGSFCLLGPCPLFLLLSLSWVLSFCGVWQGFIIIYIDSKKNQNSVYKAQWNEQSSWVFYLI
jgi:hypothetical protein